MQIDELIEQNECYLSDNDLIVGPAMLRHALEQSTQALRDLKASAEALAGFAGHDPACHALFEEYDGDLALHFPHPCTCGLDQALAAYREIAGGSEQP